MSIFSFPVSNGTPFLLSVGEQAGAVAKVDSTKEVLRRPKWGSVAASERSTAARAGTTGEENELRAVSVN